MWHKIKKTDPNIISTICRGEMAQLMVELECTKRNIIVSRPSVAVRYDLLLDINDKIYRTQIKFLNRRAGKNCLELQLSNRSQKKKCYTNKEIDLMLVYISKLDCILCLRPKDFHNKKTLRFNLINENAPTFYKKYLW